jgi:hypothetical protein
MRFESKRGQNEEKRKKLHFAIRKKTYFFYCSFSAGPLAFHFQDDL